MLVTEIGFGTILSIAVADMNMGQQTFGRFQSLLRILHHQGEVALIQQYAAI